MDKTLGTRLVSLDLSVLLIGHINNWGMRSIVIFDWIISDVANTCIRHLEFCDKVAYSFTSVEKMSGTPLIVLSKYICPIRILSEYFILSLDGFLQIKTQDESLVVKYNLEM